MSSLRPRIALILALLLALSAWPFAGPAETAEAETPARIILGLVGERGALPRDPDAVRYAFALIDASGGLWEGACTQREAESLPPDADPLIWAANGGLLTRTGVLSRDEVFTLKSLISAVGPETAVYGDAAAPSAARTVRYAYAGADRAVLDERGAVFARNVSPAGLALCERLDRLFPAFALPEGTEIVWREGFTEPPRFAPVPIAAFCGLTGLDAEGVTVTASLSDCEEGLLPTALSPEREAEILALARTGLVTGMANGLAVTGGTEIFAFRAADGTFLGVIELYEGLLAAEGGMYEIALPD